jgi:hypothetical protein
MVIATSFTVVNRKEASRMDGRIKCDMYTEEYYLTLKRKGILTQATSWVNLEDVEMLHETYQSQKDKCPASPLT